MNITDILDRWARERPDHPFLETPEGSLGFATFRAMVDRCGARLIEAGIGRGDVVVLLVPSRASLAVLLVALPRIGAVYHSLEPGLPAHELEVATRGMKVAAYVSDRSVPVPGARVLRVGALVRPVAPREIDTIPSVRVDLPEDAPAMFLRSSGTTGKPKHVLFTQGQSAFKNIHRPGILGVGPDDRALVVPGLTFNAGRQRLNEMLEAGGTMVLAPGDLGERLIEAIRTWRITYVYVTPVHVRSLLQRIEPGGPHLPGTKFFVSAAHLAPAEFAEARSRLSPRVYNFYAANEFGAVSLASPEEVEARPGTVGRAVIGVTIRIMDEEDRELPAGTVGRVVLRGENHPRAYHADPALSARCFRGGMSFPGDMGHMDADGYLYLLGRHDDIINNEGVKFYPCEVEEVLASHPAIRESCVFSVPVPGRGERPAAALVSRGGRIDIPQLLDFMRNRLSRYKVPYRLLEVRALPRNATGKVLVPALRELLEKTRVKSDSTLSAPARREVSWADRYPIHALTLPVDSLLPPGGDPAPAVDPGRFDPPFPEPRNEEEARCLFLWINGHQLFFMSLIAAASAARRASAALEAGDDAGARPWIEALPELRRGHVAFSATAANIPRAVYEGYVREVMRSMRADFSGVSSADNWVFDDSVQAMRARLAAPGAPGPEALRDYDQIDRIWWAEHARIVAALVSSPLSLAREEYERQQSAGSTRSFEDFKGVLRGAPALEENDRFFAVRRGPVSAGQLRRNWEHTVKILLPHRSTAPGMVAHWDAAAGTMQRILSAE